VSSFSVGGKAHLDRRRRMLRVVVLHTEDNQNCRCGNANGTEGCNDSDEGDTGWLIDPFGLLVRLLRGGSGRKRLWCSAAVAVMVDAAATERAYIRNARIAVVLDILFACSAIEAGKAGALGGIVGGCRADAMARTRNPTNNCARAFK